MSSGSPWKLRDRCSISSVLMRWSFIRGVCGGPVWWIVLRLRRSRRVRVVVRVVVVVGSGLDRASRVRVARSVGAVVVLNKGSFDRATTPCDPWWQTSIAIMLSHWSIPSLSLFLMPALNRLETTCLPFFASVACSRRWQR